MPCYHPMIGMPYYDDLGRLRYMPERPLSSNVHSEDIKIQNEVALERTGKKAVIIPCGHCIGCRLDNSRSWADRMMLELETAGIGLFVTLTYDNDHVPVSMYSEEGDPESLTLDKRDLQLFMKRLRKAYDGKDGRPFKKIRFFAAGEYGDNTLRPHYHAILFGVGLGDFPDRIQHGRNELGQNYYFSSNFSRLWPNGFSLLSDISWKTCAYVARYVVKKLNGPASLEYAERNVIPEFSLMSRKPGIGKRYLEIHPDCLDMANINLSTPEGGLKISIPKYYYNQLKYIPKKFDKKQNCIIEVPEENPLLDPERYDKIMEERKSAAEDQMLMELQKTNLSYLEYLEVKENRKLKSAKLLKRGAI